MNASKQSISYITLGVTDIELMRQFYTALGFDIYSQGNEPDHPYTLYRSGSIILALYPKHLLAKQAGLRIDKQSQNKAMSISLNVASREVVDDFITKAKKLNAKITKQGFEPDWGGYCGYMQDPENNLWEIVWHDKYQF